MSSIGLLFLLSTLMGSGTDLLDYLPSDDYWKAKGVTAVTAQALIKELEPVKPGADISRLLPDLDSPDFKVRDAAAARVRAMGPGVIPQLREMARSDNPEVAGRAKLLISEIGNAAKATQVRRLMAIRTLGERKMKEGLPRLAELARSNEPFVADYALAAVAAIEGRPYSRRHEAASDDAWLLPEECRAVFHMAMRGGKPVDYDAAMKAVPMFGPHGDQPQPNQPPGAEPRAAGANEVRKKFVDEIIKFADKTGNIRLDGITVGVSGDVGDQTGFVAVVVHGEYDAKAVSVVVGGLMQGANKAGPAGGADPGAVKPPQPQVNVVDGVEVFGEREFAFFFPSNKHAMLIAGPRQAEKPVAKLIAAAKTGNGGLKGAAEMVNLIKTIDTKQPVWAAVQVTDVYRQAPVLSAFDTVTLVGKVKGGAGAKADEQIDFRVEGKGKDAQQVKDAVAVVNTGIATLKEHLREGEKEMAKGGGPMAVMLPMMQKMSKALDTTQCTANGQSATLTATVDGGLLFSPMMIFGGFGMAEVELREGPEVIQEAGQGAVPAPRPPPAPPPPGGPKP